MELPLILTFPEVPAFPGVPGLPPLPFNPPLPPEPPPLPPFTVIVEPNPPLKLTDETAPELP